MALTISAMFSGYREAVKETAIILARINLYLWE